MCVCVCVFNDNKINYPSLFVQKSTQPLPVTRTVSQVSSLMRGRQLTPEAMRRKVSSLVRPKKSPGGYILFAIIYLHCTVSVRLVQCPNKLALM